MNSFFASVEQEMNPSLRGKPVAVVPLLADTTCCIAVSYEGKAFGVKTGTLVSEAKRLCPRMIFVEGDHANYIRYHNQIVEAVESCLPVHAVCSIDEMACRLTGSQRQLPVAQALVKKIKETLRQKAGSSLKCSIGIAPNRYLAKVAADMQKPDGFTVLRQEDLPQALYGLQLRDFPGIGQRTEAKLHHKNIYTVEKLCSLSAADLHRAWESVTGDEMWHLLRGEELPEKVVEQKSIGHSHVLPPEFRTPAGALVVLKKLVSKTALRLRKEEFWAQRMNIFVRFRGQEAWKAGTGFKETQDTIFLQNALSELWKGLPQGQIYAVGVSLSNLVADTRHVPTLFDDLKREELTRTIDRVNEKFGKNILHLGATQDAEDLAPLRIAFTRIPDESET